MRLVKKDWIWRTIYGIASEGYYFAVIGCGTWSLTIRTYSP